MGATKPWHPGYCGKFGREYRRYLKKYPDTDPVAVKEWKKRHMVIAKHLSEVVIRKMGGQRNAK